MSSYFKKFLVDCAPIAITALLLLAWPLQCPAGMLDDPNVQGTPSYNSMNSQNQASSQIDVPSTLNSTLPQFDSNGSITFPSDNFGRNSLPSVGANGMIKQPK